MLTARRTHLIYLISCLCCTITKIIGIDNAMRQNVLDGLNKNNFMGVCKYDLVDPLEVGAFPLLNSHAQQTSSEWTLDMGFVSKSTSSITVYVYPPNPTEIEQQKLLPNTLTSANSLLGSSSRAVRWGKLKETMWQIPLSHPRQRKQYCVDLAREAGLGDPIAFYLNDTIRHANTFYLLELKGSVMLHEMGIVATKCGWVQPVEACETMYRFIGRRWHKSCLANITAFKTNWDAIFEGTVISPAADRVHRLNRVAAPQRAANATTVLDWNERTLVSSQLSHLCFPAEVTQPGRKQRLAGVEANYTHKLVHRVPRVFSIASQWDNNYHHFIVDGLSRLARHLDWLLQNPDVFIHIRAFERIAKKDRYITGGRILRRGFWELLGIDARRVIYGNVLADVAWVPRSTRCNEPLASSMELRLLSARLISAANADIEPAYSDEHVFIGDNVSLPVQQADLAVSERKRVLLATRHQAATDDFVDDDKGQGHHMPEPGAAVSARPLVRASSAVSAHDRASKTLLRRPLLVIQQRVCSEDAECRKTWREFDEATHRRVVRAFQTQYGDNYRIVVVSSANAQLTACIACQIRLYRQADVLVGVHGAGLTNIMFMKPGSVLIELTGDFDGRMAPVCGYHGPLAATYGVHHYLYLWDWIAGGKQPPTDTELEDIAQRAYQFGLAVGSK